MPFANRKQTVGTGLVHGARVAPSYACACRLVAAWSKRHNFSRQTHNRNISKAPVRGLTTVAVPCRAAGELLPPMCSRVAPTKLGTEHVVGESVVVPGLKLTDHTFQVRCPRAVDHGFCKTLLFKHRYFFCWSLVLQVDLHHRYPWIITTSKPKKSTCLCEKSLL